MKLLALGTPLLVLGVIFLLQRLEAWALPSPRSRRGRVAAAAPTRNRPVPPPATGLPTGRRKMMNDQTSPTPDERDGPLLRDPPPPPGYVDPLDESQALRDLSQLPGPYLVRSARTGPARRSPRRER